MGSYHEVMGSYMTGGCGCPSKMLGGDASKYEMSMSSKMKSDLIRKLYELSKSLTNAKSTASNEEEMIREINRLIRGPETGTGNLPKNLVGPVCRKMAEHINAVAPDAVSLSGSDAEICMSVGLALDKLWGYLGEEVVHVNQYFKQIIRNLDTASGALKQLQGELKSKMDGTTMDLAAKNEMEDTIAKMSILITYVDDMIKQLRKVTDTRLTNLDKELNELLEKKQYDKALALLKMESSEMPVNRKLYTVVAMINPVAQKAALVQKALKDAQLDVAQYKDMKTQAQLRDTIDELIAKKLSSMSKDDRIKFEKAIQLLEDTFADHDRIVKEISGGAQSSSLLNPVKTVDKELQEKAELLKYADSTKPLARAFRRSNKIYMDKILRAGSRYAESIKMNKSEMNDTFKYFYDSLSSLSSYDTDQLVEAFGEFKHDPAYDEYKTRYIATLRDIIFRNKEFISSGKLTDTTPANEFNKVVDDYISFLTKYKDIKEGRMDKVIEEEDMETVGGDDMGIPLTLTSLIDSFRYYGNVSSLNMNLNLTEKDLSSYQKNQDKLDEVVFGNMIKERNDFFDKSIAQGEILMGTGKDSPLNYFNEMKLAQANMLRALQGLDKYMRVFNEAIIKNPQGINTLKQMVEGISIESNWFTEEAFKLIYKFYTDMGTGKTWKEAKELRDKTLKKAMERIGVLHNFVRIFYYIGNKFGNVDVAKESGLSIGQVYKIMVNWMIVSSLAPASTEYVEYKKENVVSLKDDKFVARTFQLSGAFIPKCDTHVYSAADLKEYLNNLVNPNIGNKSIKIDGLDQIDAPNAANLNQYINRINNPTGAEKTMGVQLTTIDTRGNVKYEYIKLNNGKFEVGSPIPVVPTDKGDLMVAQKSLVEMDNQIDKYFIMMLKTMSSKIFEALGVYDLMNRKDYVPANTVIRTMLGAADYTLLTTIPEVRTELAELYLRLPLYLMWYKKLFETNMEGGENFSAYIFTVFPEMDNVFGSMIKFAFVDLPESKIPDRGFSISNFSNNQINLLVRECNKIYDHYRNLVPAGYTVDRYIISEFIKEMNRRYGVAKRQHLIDVQTELRKRELKSRTSLIPSTSTADQEVYEALKLPGEDESVNMGMVPSDDIASPSSTLFGQLQSVSANVNLDLDAMYKLIYCFRTKLDELLQYETPDNKQNIFGSLIRDLKMKLSKAQNNEDRFNIIIELFSTLGSGDTTSPIPSDIGSSLINTTSAVFMEIVVAGLDNLSLYMNQMIAVIVAINQMNDNELHKAISLLPSYFVKSNLSGKFRFDFGLFKSMVEKQINLLEKLSIQFKPFIDPRILEHYTTKIVNIKNILYVNMEQGDKLDGVDLSIGNMNNHLSGMNIPAANVLAAIQNSNVVNNNIKQFAYNPNEEGRIGIENGNIRSQAIYTGENIIKAELSPVQLFNQLLYWNINEFFDVSSNKIYKKLVEAIYSSDINTAIMNDANNLNDETARENPVDNNGACLFRSIANLYKLVYLTKRDTKTRESKYLEDDLSVIPEYMKEKYRCYLPILLNYTKRLIDLTNAVNRAINNANANGYSDLLRAHNTILNVAYVMQNTFTAVYKDLNDNIHMLELSKSFIESYKSSTGNEPISTLSMLFPFMGYNSVGNTVSTNGFGNLLPINPSSSTNFKYLYGVRGLSFNNQSYNPSIKDFPWLLNLINGYNSKASGTYSLNESHVQEYVKNYLDILREANRVSVNQMLGYATPINIINYIKDAAPFNQITVWNGAAITDGNITFDNYYEYFTIEKFILMIEDRGNSALKQKLYQNYEIAPGARPGSLIDTPPSTPPARIATLPPTLTRTEYLMIKNIIDYDIVPINIHAMMREIPISTIFNCVYNFDKILKTIELRLNPNVLPEKIFANNFLINPFVNLRDGNPSGLVLLGRLNYKGLNGTKPPGMINNLGNNINASFSKYMVYSVLLNETVREYLFDELVNRQKLILSSAEIIAPRITQY